MGRLKTLKSRVESTPGRIAHTLSTKDRRITGLELQRIREHHWLKDPHCARCGRYVGYPDGFELDHKIPLHQGGPDTDDNRQILCVDEGDREGCHPIKTREDMKT